MEEAKAYEAPIAILTSTTRFPTHISLEPLQFALETSFQVICSESTQTSLDSHRIRPRLSPKRVGRKVSQVNKVLRAFQREQISRTYQPPKLENVRYRVMRTLKKVLRRLEKGKPLGSKGLMAIDYHLESVSEAFARFRDYAAMHSEVIRQFYEVSNGPKVDKGRLKFEKESQFSTYNNSYMYHIFSSVEIRIVYRLFLTVIFAEKNPASLNSRFSIWCCTRTIHDEICEGKWKAFREMLDQYLGANLPEEIRMEKIQGVGVISEQKSKEEMIGTEG